MSKSYTEKMENLPNLEKFQIRVSSSLVGVGAPIDTIFRHAKVRRKHWNSSQHTTLKRVSDKKKQFSHCEMGISYTMSEIIGPILTPPINCR